MSIGVYTFLQGKNLLMREIRIWEGIGENLVMNGDVQIAAILRASLRPRIRGTRIREPQSREVAPKIVNSLYLNPIKEALSSLRHVDSTGLRLKAAMTRFVEHLIVRRSRNDGNPLSHHFNRVFSHAYSAIHHINGYVSKTNYNFESK